MNALRKGILLTLVGVTAMTAGASTASARTVDLKGNGCFGTLRVWGGGGPLGYDAAPACIVTTTRVVVKGMAGSTVFQTHTYDFGWGWHAQSSIAGAQVAVWVYRKSDNKLLTYARTGP